MEHADHEFYDSIGVSPPFSHLRKAATEDMLKYCRQKILDTINNLEREAHKFNKLDEDTLTTIIATSLQSTPYITAERESLEGGHCDLRITMLDCSPAASFTYIGEAKIWRDESWALKGYDQLTLKYNRCRHSNSFLLTYVQNDSFEPFERLKSIYSSQRNFKLIESQDIESKAYFRGVATTKDDACYTIDSYGAHFHKKKY